MANRPPSDDPGSKPELAIESKGLLRQWTEGMRMEALANLAHELRTPLQVLLGYLDILRDEWVEKFDPEPRAMIERMNSNTHDLAQTVDNIMEFVMSEAGATGRVEEDVLVSNLVNDLAPAIEAAKAGKELTLKVDLEHAPQSIHISRRPLRSILANLVLNAIKFTERGSVTVRISSAPARGAEPGVVLEVTDTGLGMSPALIKHAAEPFSQLSRTSARKYRGLGLGLAVVHRNVQALGGKLDGLDNLAVAGASADIAGNAVPDFVLRRLRIFFQEPMRAQDHAGRAEAALQAVHLAEAFLQMR